MNYGRWRESGMKPDADITSVNKICQLHYFICNVSVGIWTNANNSVQKITLVVYIRKVINFYI
jgi:hypothetical protein